MNDGIRLNKYISHNSKYSRREAVVTDLATKVYKGDKVYIHDRFMHPKNEFTVIVYHKKKGELVTKKDDRGRKTIYDNLSKRYHHFIPVGRLDFASEGLILLTDAPDIATALMTSNLERVLATALMTSNLERVYYLKIRGRVTEAMQTGMKEGLQAEFATKGAHERSEIVSMDFKPFNWYKVQKDDARFSKLKVSISEGKNRELRRFFGYYDSEVMDLKRVEFGGVSLDIPAGKMRFLSKTEYHSLHTFLQGLKKSQKDG